MKNPELPYSAKHDEYKRMAKEHLKSLGFLNDEIIDEYYIAASTWKDTNGNILKTTRKFMVDVAGIKKDGSHSIAFECGMCPPEKLLQLNLFFDEVWQLPYIQDRFAQTSRIIMLEEQLKVEKNLRESFIRERIEQEKEIIGKIILKTLQELDLIPECLGEHSETKSWKIKQEISQWNNLKEEFAYIKKKPFEVIVYEGQKKVMH
jgi:hypothetical protein